MGRITSGGAVWADHNSHADDRNWHVTNCDSAVAVWILIWLFRLARDQIGVSTFAAICFVVGRFAVELAIGLLAGVQTGIGLG